MSIRFLIIESSPIVAKGLCTIIDEQSGWEVVGVIHSMELHHEQIQQLKPDVVVCNPILIGVKQQAEFNFLVEAQTRSMVGLLYCYVPQKRLLQFERFIELNDTAEQIVLTLQQAVAPRKEVVDRGDDIVEEVVDSYELSDREQEVLVLVAKGKMNKEIADELNISIHTVFSHRKNIARKTGIKSVAGLTVYALLNNLIKQGDL